MVEEFLYVRVCEAVIFGTSWELRQEHVDVLEAIKKLWHRKFVVLLNSLKIYLLVVYCSWLRYVELLECVDPCVEGCDGLGLRLNGCLDRIPFVSSVA